MYKSLSTLNMDYSFNSIITKYGQEFVFNQLLKGGLEGVEHTIPHNPVWWNDKSYISEMAMAVKKTDWQKTQLSLDYELKKKLHDLPNLDDVDNQSGKKIADAFSLKEYISWNWKGDIWSECKSMQKKIFPISKELFICFDYFEDIGIIRLYTYDNLKLNKGDTISFLFEDGDILDYAAKIRPITTIFNIEREDFIEKSNKFKNIKEKHTETTFYSILYAEDIKIFLDKKLISYRINFAKEDKMSIDKAFDANMLEGYINEALHFYLKEYLKTINRLIPSYVFPSRKVTTLRGKYEFPGCYVYLMRDNTNGYHKIGISNNPEYREKTLQSEKPSIEMLVSKKYPTRKIAEAIESALHSAYSQQRLRGEWFNLNDADVAAIIETLQ